MAFSHGSGAAVHYNGYDLTAYFSAFDSQGTTDTAETTTFQQTAKTYIAGLSDGQLSGEGYFDSTAGGIEDKLNQSLSNRTENNIVSYWPNGDTIGRGGRGLSGVETKYEVKSDVGDANKVSAEWQSSVGSEGLVSLHALGAETAAGTATVVDNAAGSDGHPCSYLHVTACAGGTLTVKVQHSHDNSSYSDLLTHTAVTSATAPIGERIETSGTVGRYLRSTWTLTGGTATFSHGAGRYAN